ncbi:MAG: SBBP repeat-containing protein, partial [Anaerolineales bacterium]|nr:SBBP repeat-containing protein [Anaerolineales bacterium]
NNVIAAPFTAEWVEQGNYEAQATSLSDVLYSTYLGILSYDGGRLAIGPTGKAYVGGMTHPYFGDEQSGFCNVANDLPCNQGFVARLSANGQNLEQLLIFGGSNDDYVEDIVVNQAGEIFVTGTTASTNFPTTAGAVSTTHGSGTFDGFVSKINATGGTFAYSTYLPGTTEEASYGLAVDPAGMAYAAGWFTNGAHRDAVVIKLNSTGTATVYGSALGGSGRDEANDIAVNPNGEVFVTGYTESTNFPVTSGVVGSSKGTGGNDGFVVRLQANADYSYATYLPGNTAEIGRGIAIDSNNNAYITGVYDSSGQDNALALKLNPTGTTTVYGTGFGGSAADEGYEIAVDEFGQAYITGFTNSTNFQVTADAIQNSKPAHSAETQDSFVTKFDLNGQLIYGSYFGGNELDYGTGIGVGDNAAVYMTGFTNSASIAEGGGFPVTNNSYRSIYVPGCQDPFVARLAIGPGQLYIPLITTP